MKNEIEQQIFEKMKAKDFGESMCNETKLNVLKWTMQQLRKHDVGGSLDLDSLKKRLDEALSKETPESLREWLKSKRQ
jgi:hypothetical protein